MDSDYSHDVRLLSQGPGYQRRLFVLNPDGAPYLPKSQHENVLERYSRADAPADIWTANLVEMEKALSRLSLTRDLVKVWAISPFRATGGLQVRPSFVGVFGRFTCSGPTLLRSHTFSLARHQLFCQL